MAITSINITQDNKVGDSNLVPIHSPVVFIADASYTGLPPDELTVNIYTTGPTLVDTYRAIYLEDQISGVRRFAFIANAAIKSLMESYTDFYQLNESLELVDDITQVLIIEFADPDAPTTKDTVLIDFCHAYRQFGEAPNMTDIYNNTGLTYYGAKNSFVYVYYYISGSPVSVSVTDNGIPKGSLPVGANQYLRYKTTADVKKTIVFDNGVTQNTFYVEPVEACDGGLLLKYLDKNGQYRFFPFNKFYQITDNPQLIGTVNKFITSILTAQSNTEAVGFNNKRSVSIVADDVTNEQLTILSDIYTSPNVYYYIGSGTDTISDWVKVTITSTEGLVKRRKGNSSQVAITFEMPEHFTTKLI